MLRSARTSVSTSSIDFSLEFHSCKPRLDLAGGDPVAPLAASAPDRPGQAVSRSGGVDDDGPGGALPELKAALGELALEARAVVGPNPRREACRVDAGKRDARPAFDQSLLWRHRRDRLCSVDQAMLRHPHHHIVAAFLRKAEGDRTGVRRRRRRQAERVADDDVDVGSASEVLRDVDGAPIRTDQAVGPVLVPPAAFDMLGAAVRLPGQPEFLLERSPPCIEHRLAVGRAGRWIAMHMVDRPARAAMPGPGDDLSKLRVKVLSGGDPTGLDHLGDLALFRFEQMRREGAAALPWRCPADHRAALRLIWMSAPTET